MTTIDKIQRQIAENPILLYMKGSPKLPNCGFSAQAVQALVHGGFGGAGLLLEVLGFDEQTFMPDDGVA